MKLTTKAIASAALPKGKSDAIFFDDEMPGFGLRLRASGFRTFVFQYRMGHATRRLTLGSATAATLAMARKKAAELQAKVRLGGDPGMDKANARQAAADTFGVLVDKYMAERHAEWRPKTEVNVRYHLSTMAASLHTMPITAISQRKVADLLDRIAEETGAVSANRVRTSMAAFFAWAIKKGIELPKGNIVANTGKRPEKSRERVLTSDELKAIWKASRDDRNGAVVKMLILTGQRAGEIGNLRWTEIHDDQIMLPPERTNNQRLHTIPLGDVAKAVLASLPRSGEFVFGRAGYQNWGKHKTFLREAIGVDDWTFHDFRRTVATGMADLGIQPHIIEAVLNHVSGHKAGVAGIYNRSTYDAEKRQALDMWAHHIEALIEGRKSSVVAMKRGA
jgi:integrase